MLRFALFDLDDTLYASQCGLWAAIGSRIDQYLVERMGLPVDGVLELRRRYLDSFGSTLNGLRHEYQVDAEDYLAFVHDLPLHNYLQPSPDLDAMLGRLPLAKVIFTNADAPHAQRVLACLGIARHFERIIDIHALAFTNKPDPRAYRLALAQLGARPEECIFIDDAPRNLRAAHDLGLHTVLVSSSYSGPRDGIDHQIQSILEVESVLAVRASLGEASFGEPGAAR